MRFGWSSKVSFQRVLWVALVFSVLVTIAYFLVYWYQPFSDFVNNLLSNLFSQAISLICAVFSTLILMRYEKNDAPRKIWAPFAVGLWLWFAGEISWGAINMTVGEVPTGLPDVFWSLSYVFFGRALLFQYRVLKQSDERELRTRVVLAAGALVTLILVTYALFISGTATDNPFSVFVNSFYPAADLTLAMIALWLARSFSGGAFSRPWLGLLVFTVADLMYAWLEASGMYAWSVAEGNLLTTIADMAYLVSYLVLALGLLYQWLFLKYGLRPLIEAR